MVKSINNLKRPVWRWLSKRINANKLTSIGIKYGTDKATHHRYTDFYSEILKGRDIKSMLEIGILKGASLKMWREYFPESTIVGVDINPIYVQDCITLQADALNPADLLGEVNSTGICNYDLIIDDGGHTMRQQQTAFNTLWPLIAPGGIYIIEDVHTSRIPQYKYPGDAITTEDWIRNDFKGSNYAQPVNDVSKVKWWHNKVNDENDSITVAIFKTH